MIPYSSKWFGSHAVSNGRGYRQLHVSVNQPSTRSDCEIVSSSLPCHCRYDTRCVKRFTSFSNAVKICLYYFKLVNNLQRFFILILYSVSVERLWGGIYLA